MDAVHSIDELLASIEALQASDLHIAAGSHPLVRVNGVLGPLEDTPELTAAETQPLLYRILTTEQQKRLEVERQIDISYAISGIGRFRVNVFFQRGAVGAAFRLIPHKIKTLEELGHPPVLRKLTELPRGLVLVTGPTGSGKSTTLAAMVDEINRNREGHILTIEDPIEFIHRHRKCLVNQREIGGDARGFAEALRGALRQDPDVILLGEMRDLETISTALTAAETGHLVFARSILAERQRPSTASSTSSRPSSRRRCAPSSLLPSKVSSPRRCCRRPTGGAGSPRWRSCCPTTPSGT